MDVDVEEEGVATSMVEGDDDGEYAIGPDSVFALACVVREDINNKSALVRLY